MKLTVFTPTYNRAKMLGRVYGSLLSQTVFDFEWLIIDDGSEDETGETVKSFSQDKFPVRYIKQENGGKHRAHNRALTEARGEYFFCLDSDDMLSPDAVERIISAAGEEDIMIAYKKTEEGKLLSTPFPETEISSFAGLSDAGISGEFTIIFKTAFARANPFPEFDGEKFLTEAVLYDRMRDTAARLLPHPVTVCEYMADGLSENLNRIMKDNPAGYCLYFMQRIDMQKSMRARLMTAGKYNCFCSFAGEKKSEYGGEHRAAAASARPLGWLFRLYYKCLRGF